MSTTSAPFSPPASSGRNGYGLSNGSDFWADVPSPASSAILSGHRPEIVPQPLERLRRLFRGRLVLAIVLAVVGTLVGAAIGWMSQKPIYRADGWAIVEAYVPRADQGGENRPHYPAFMRTEALQLGSIPMAERAISMPAWRKVDVELSPAQFVSKVNVSHSGQDMVLDIRFQDEDRRVAVAGVRALLEAYQEFFGERREQQEQYRLGQLRQAEQRIRREHAEAVELRQEVSSRYGGIDSLGEQHARQLALKQVLETDLERLQRDHRQAVEARERARDAESLTVADLRAADPVLDVLLSSRTELNTQIRQARGAGFGDRNRTLNRLQRQLTDVEEEITQRSNEVRQRYFGTVPSLDGNGQIAVTQTYIDGLTARMSEIERVLNESGEHVSGLGRDGAQLANLNDYIRRHEADLERVLEQQQTLEADRNIRAEMGELRVNPPASGSTRIAHDKRNQMAVGGGMLGFAIPVGLVLLAGLMDNRLRYSDDTADARLAGGRPNLLGILPNLPDRLSDPNQASIAAHCVHQIRTILQINHGSDGPRAFAVTSAGRGDGKTSLALALGLSYAASGARTLLIDTDLLHGGLSERLGVKQAQGVMDALTGGDLLEFVCETDVDDLALLPIGRAASNHAGAFSPGAVMHLLDTARRHFDVVVIDTGPIMGSIEATPIASAVDGVVTCVSRGQSRTLVNKALAHLNTIGATVSGLVFNRAQTGDFERSVNGMSLRVNGRTRRAHGSDLARN